jgi:hypothetical protein
MNPLAGTQASKNAYTNAPELHGNWLLSSLQLLFWLFFHPSAWRNHVARFDPALSSDFCLAELTRTQWRNPALRRLLINGYIVWPLLIASLVSLVLWGLGRSASEITYGVALSTVLGLAGGVAVGTAFSLAFGVTVGVTFGLACAVEYVADRVVGAGGIEYALAAGLVLGAAASVASERRTYPFAQYMRGVVTGGLIGGLALGLVSLVAYFVAGGVPSSAESFVLARVDIVAYDVVSLVAGSLVLGLTVGWRTGKWRRGLGLGLALGVAYAAAYAVAGFALHLAQSPVMDGLAFGVQRGIWRGVRNSVPTVLPYALAEPIAGPWAGAVAGALAYVGWATIRHASVGTPVGLAVLVLLAGTLVGLTQAWWRPVILWPFTVAWNRLLYRADEWRAGDRSSLLRWHSAFWDEHQRLPLVGLSEHLVLVMERYPAEGRAAIEYLATGYQRWAAQAAQIELDARGLERCTDIGQIRHAHRRLAAGALEGPASALLRSFSRTSQDVDAALHQQSSYNRRLALSAIEDRLDGLLRELTRSSEPYAVRFRPIATDWRRIVADHVCELAKEADLRQEIDNPYVIGVPLTEQQEIFVGRTDIGARIEGLLLDRTRTPLLLFGQRRTGKTSLLNNLGRLLPSTIVPLFVDLQGPASRASDHAGLLYNIARAMIDSAQRQRDLSLPPLSREALTADPFTCFDEWLDQVEVNLRGRTALLALDEFEALDSAIGKGHFDEEVVLGMLRHLIQHRPCFKALLAGSHTLDELQRWASYLINVQVVHISFLEESEARQLVERPVRGFALRYEPDASQRVLDLTRGHPFLVQLLCAEIVALKNEQSPTVRRLAHLSDVESAVPEALSHGSFFFADIERNQVDRDGLALLRFLATQGETVATSRTVLNRQFMKDLDPILDLLIRRELVEPTDAGYRFQVELIRRWFARSGASTASRGSAC